MEIHEIKKLICESFLIDLSDFNSELRNQEIKRAQYMFCYFVVKETDNKRALNKHLSTCTPNKVNEYLKRHEINLLNQSYRKIAEKIERKINET